MTAIMLRAFDTSDSLSIRSTAGSLPIARLDHAVECDNRPMDGNQVANRLRWDSGRSR